jgi:DeoR family glycerol-3-phosphate regulon repressor
VHPEAGLTDYYPAEVAVRRTIIDHTALNYVLADSSKLGEIAVHRVCTLDRLTAVLTDDAENSAASAALAAAGLTLLRARVMEQPQATAAGGRPRLTAAP